MFAGPIIAREVLTAPRPIRFYVARASYVGLLFILMWTAWQSQVGLTRRHAKSASSRYFGAIMLSPVLRAVIQLTLILFFAPLIGGHGGGAREGPAGRSSCC